MTLFARAYLLRGARLWVTLRALSWLPLRLAGGNPLDAPVRIILFMLLLPLTMAAGWLGR